MGHSTHDPEPFLGLLRAFEIGLVADVRRHPASRRVPHFNAGELEPLLAASGIGYEHMAELGGRRRPVTGSPNAGWRSDQFQGYADHMGSAEFVSALERLLELAAARPTAVMCAEAQWTRCHRRLLSDAVLARGLEVLHIDARGGTEPHGLTGFAVVDRGRVIYPPVQAQLDV
ncbi:MAG: DUF488 family protein [Thermoleophilaceae bacterium]